MVRDAEVAQLEGEADEVGDEVGGVDAPVDEDGAVDVGVASGGVDGRLRSLADWPTEKTEGMVKTGRKGGRGGGLPPWVRAGRRCSR